MKFEPNFHRQSNFWILPDFKCLQLREGQECDIWAEFSSRVHFLDFAQFWVKKCEIWAKFSSTVEFLVFQGFQVFAGPGGARMRNSRRIFIASAFSWFCPILGAKMWNLSQIFIASLISGFCRISSVYRSVRCKNEKFEPNFHRECIFWILPNFGGKNVKFEPNFHRQFNFWILPDFKCLQVSEVQECEIRAEFSSRLHFLDFAQFWGAKMWNLCQIFIGSGISGFCWVSSVYRSGKVQQCVIRAEFLSRVHFLNFARFWGQKCEIWAKFSSAVEFLDFAGFQVFTSSGRGKNVIFEPNFHREYIFLILPNFGVQKCEIWAKFSSVVEFLDFAGFQVFACPGSARMRYSSRIFIASSFSGFCPNFGGKNVKFDPNFHRQWNFWILPDFKCLQLREGQECDIWAEFSSRVHFLDFAQFWVKKCEIWAKFSSAVEFLDFQGFQVFAGPGGARMRNSRRIFIASAFSWFCPILGAKMWNLSQIFIASLPSGFCRISSVYRSVRCKNAKFEPNFHREWIFWILPNFGGKNVKFEPNFHRQFNFWILPDFKCLQVSEVQECEIRAEFSSRVHFLDFAQFWGQKCGICAKFSSAVEFLDFAGFQVFTGQWGARMRNSSRIFIASAFSGFCPILGAKMWNLCQIFIGSGISGFCRISSVYRSVRYNNA